MCVCKIHYTSQAEQNYRAHFIGILCAIAEYVQSPPPFLLDQKTPGFFLFSTVRGVFVLNRPFPHRL